MQQFPVGSQPQGRFSRGSAKRVARRRRQLSNCSAKAKWSVFRLTSKSWDIAIGMIECEAIGMNEIVSIGVGDVRTKLIAKILRELYPKETV